MSVPDVKRLRGVEAENRRFKKLLAESIRNGVQLKLIEADKPTQNA